MPVHDAFTIDAFRFRRVLVEEGRVLAELSEREGLAGVPSIYTQDESQVHGLVEGVLRAIESGAKSKKVMRNREELTRAFRAVRDRKIELGLDLSVSDPAV